VRIGGLGPTARRAEQVGPSKLLTRREGFLPLCGDVLEFLTGCLKDGLQSAY
jgi:hypothetical protein